jgi:hypothetical protein
MHVADREIQHSEQETVAGSTAARISLQFAEDVSPGVRARICYAFQVFAANYNYRVVPPDVGCTDYRCIYAQSAFPSGHPRTLHIPARYRFVPSGAPNQPLSKYHYAGEDFYLAHGIDAATGNPDWLGELFMWLSNSHEMAATDRDAVGRIPYAQTICGIARISPRKPYASLLMAWMENALRNGNAQQALPKAPSPIKNVDHIVLPSHDVDFCYTTKTSAFLRLLKNLVISGRLYRSASFFTDNAKYILELMQGKRVGDYLPALLLEVERQDFRSTFFAVARHGHRRDPDYSIARIAAHLRDAGKRGFSVGVHGSYGSIVQDGTLPVEAETLASHLVKYPFGGRQHWLRFDRPDHLFREVERARLRFDSSLGFPDKVGFRNGASFAYPPYNFDKEAPHNFLEFPLALMDGSVEAECRISRENPQFVADEILRESRTRGWGGISILWHNPMEALQVPAEINRVFWNCAEKRHEFRESWMTTDRFFQICLRRFHQAGLLAEIPADA